MQSYERKKEKEKAKERKIKMKVPSASIVKGGSESRNKSTTMTNT